jgi:hypothetical protein
LLGSLYLGNLLARDANAVGHGGRSSSRPHCARVHRCLRLG